MAPKKVPVEAELPFVGFERTCGHYTDGTDGTRNLWSLKNQSLSRNQHMLGGSIHFFIDFFLLMQGDETELETGLKLPLTPNVMTSADAILTQTKPLYFRSYQLVFALRMWVVYGLWIVLLSQSC